MSYFYERNIVEIKNEYTTFLTNIMTPLIYEGIKSLYDSALKKEEEIKELMIKNPDATNPGVLKIFQNFLKAVPDLNSNKIELETNRIKEKSKCSEWFDDLVKAVVKSNIVLLTYNVSEKKCKLVNDKYHENVDVKLFVHKSYIECARIFYNYPEIFWHKYTTLDIKRNQREAYDLIKSSIVEAIRKMLPIKMILEEYLKNDYVKGNDDITANVTNSQFMNMKSLIQRDLNGGDMNKFNEEDNESNNENNDVMLESNYEQENREITEHIDEIDKKLDNSIVLTENSKESDDNDTNKTDVEFMRKLNDPEYTQQNGNGSGSGVRNKALTNFVNEVVNEYKTKKNMTNKDDSDSSQSLENSDNDFNIDVINKTSKKEDSEFYNDLLEY
jgi:hypothetical protein